MAAGASDPSSTYLASALTTAPHLLGFPVIGNLPAFLIVALITVILIIGIRESANSNNAMVLLKIGVILFFCAVGLTLIKPHHWTDPALGGFAPNGWAGISAGAAIIFFSYIGFDATSTAAEEAKDPARDMPFGIIMSLVVCTVLYIVLSLVMTGMAPWNRLGTAEPMITALALADGSPRLLNISRFIVSLGAVVAMSSVLLVFQLGQPRIFMSMARTACSRRFWRGSTRGSRPPTSVPSSPASSSPPSRRSPTSPRWWTSPTSGRCLPSCWCRPA